MSRFTVTVGGEALDAYPDTFGLVFNAQVTQLSRGIKRQTQSTNVAMPDARPRIDSSLRKGRARVKLSAWTATATLADRTTDEPTDSYIDLGERFDGGIIDSAHTAAEMTQATFAALGRKVWVLEAVAEKSVHPEHRTFTESEISAASRIFYSAVKGVGFAALATIPMVREQTGGKRKRRALTLSGLDSAIEIEGVSDPTERIETVLTFNKIIRSLSVAERRILGKVKRDESLNGSERMTLTRIRRKAHDLIAGDKWAGATRFVASPA